MATLTTSWKTYASSSFSTGAATVTFYLEAKYSSQNIAGNTTSVQTRLRSAITSGYSIAGAGYKFTCTYAPTVEGSAVWNFGNEVITSGSSTVTHNTNGTKSITLNASAYNRNWNFTRNMSVTVSLPTIPRTATVTSAPNFNDEATLVSVSFKNPGGFQLRPYMNFYISGKLVLSITRPKASISSPYVWAITEAEQKQMRTALKTVNSCQVNIGFDTFSGNTQIGYNSLAKTFSIVNANPIFSDFTFADINSTSTSLTGNNQKIIKGYSKVQATISATNKAVGQKEADITKYRLTIGNASVDIAYNESADVTGTIDNVENGTINVYAIDTRGNSTLVTKLASEEIEYDPVYVNVNNSSFKRDDNRVGDNGILTLNGTFWNDSFGTTTNSIAVSYRLKKSDSSTWINGTTTITPTITDNDFTFSGMIASNNPDTTWDLQSSYDLEITVTDELSASITTYILASAVPTLSLDKEGVGVMCQYDTSIGGGLQVYGEPIGVEKKVVIDYSVETATNNLTFDLPETKETDIFEMYVLGTVNTAANQDISIQFNDITSGYYSCMMLQYTNGTADGNLTGSNLFRANKGQFYTGSSLGHTVSAMKYEFFVSNNKILCNWDINIFGDGSALKGVGKSAGYINSYQTKINKIKLFATTTTTTKFNAGTRILIIKK